MKNAFATSAFSSAGGSGTVSSVGLSVPAFLSVAGSPVTTSGTLAITLSGTALPVANGGTGITSFGTGVAPWLGTPTVANLNTALGITLATTGANTFTALQTITQASANAGVLASTGYSLTGSNNTSMVDLAGTLNTTGVVTVFKMNINNTASGSGSLLMDLQVGGSSKFSISGTSGYTISVATGITAQGSFNLQSTWGVDGSSGNQTMYSGGSFGWAPGNGGAGVTCDLTLWRQAADTLGQRRGANAQAFQLFNTYTSSTNNEQLEQGWASNVAHLWTVKGSGGGTARNLALGFDSTAVITLSSALATIISGGALKLGNAAVTGLTAGVLSALTNASITVQDSTGQTYRIPVII